MRYITKTEKETFTLAKKLAKTLRGGETISLLGNLGAGKTIFSKGLAAGLGIKKHITSPTFVIMKIYPIKSRSLSGTRSAFNRVDNLVHIDAYRLKSYKDLEAIGAREYLGKSDTVAIIEWADRVKKILPKNTKFVKITNKGENKRKIIIN